MLDMLKRLEKLVKKNLLGFLILILIFSFGLFLLGFNIGRYYFKYTG